LGSIVKKLEARVGRCALFHHGVVIDRPKLASLPLNPPTNKSRVFQLQTSHCVTNDSGKKFQSDERAQSVPLRSCCCCLDVCGKC
jgi:hypothetical protein